MNVHKSLLLQILAAYAITVILYCPPILFPELLNEDLTSIKKMRTSASNMQWFSLLTHI